MVCQKVNKRWSKNIGLKRDNKIVSRVFTNRTEIKSREKMV